MDHIFFCELDMPFSHKMTHKSLVGNEKFVAGRTILSLILVDVLVVRVPANYLSLWVLVFESLSDAVFDLTEILQWSRSLMEICEVLIKMSEVC